MKIVVIGGTGLIGSKLVTGLGEQGHETVAASPHTGVDALTGEGLAEALSGASVVTDVSNSPSLEDTRSSQRRATATGPAGRCSEGSARPGPPLVPRR
jgi:uncharacterized protein YbjT (DUF2867 family)